MNWAVIHVYSANKGQFTFHMYVSVIITMFFLVALTLDMSNSHACLIMNWISVFDNKYRSISTENV